MKIIIGLAGIALVLAGVVTVILARRYKTPLAPPVPSFNPKNWVQPWKIAVWYTPKGEKLYHTSHTLLMAGIGLMLVSLSLPL
jgi:hypothetical protein